MELKKERDMSLLVDPLRRAFGDVASGIRSFWAGPFTSGDRELARLFGGARTHSGVTVTTENVSGLSAVWACVTLVAGSIASLPLVLYRRAADGGRERFTNHALYEVLHTRPNLETSAVQFWESMVTALLLRGNAFAEVARSAGRPSLWFLHPDRVSVRRDSNERLIYDIQNSTRPAVTLATSDILHIRGPMSDDGLTGQSVIAAARETFGEALAHQQYGSAFFANGAAMGGILTHPGKMTKEAKEAFRAALLEQYAGPDRAHQLLLLEEGIKYEKVTISPEDAQFIEGRRFSVEEVARLFGVPVHMIGGARTGLTYSNSETEALNFLKFTLGPWLARIASAVNHTLIAPSERFQMYAEHLPDALLATDTQARYTAYGLAIDKGFMTVPEVRRRENLPALTQEDGA
jgi:HK97 family phage portal protein